MKADIMKSRAHPDGSPSVIDLAQVRARFTAGDDPWVAGQARQAGEKLDCPGRERGHGCDSAHEMAAEPKQKSRHMDTLM